MDASLPRRLVAEALGTGLLILFGPGSVVAALRVGGGELDYAGLGIIGLSFGLVVALVIYAFGSTSGAHINPAVTVALASTRRFPWREVGPYVVAQLVGAVLGGLLIVAAFGTASVAVSNVGAVSFGEGVGLSAGDPRRDDRHVPPDADDHGAGGRQARSCGLGRSDDRSLGDLHRGRVRAADRCRGQPRPRVRARTPRPRWSVATCPGANCRPTSWAVCSAPCSRRSATTCSPGRGTRRRPAEPAQGTQGDIVGRRAGGQGGEPPSTAGRRRSKGDVRAQRRG